MNKRTIPLRSWLIVFGLAAAVACRPSLPSDGPTDSGPDSGEAGGGDAGDGDSGALPTPVALPFAVDDQFASSGYMGAGQVAGGVVDTALAADCGETVRQGEGAGLCHHFVVTQTVEGEGATAVTHTWGGVFWQHPANNWCLEGRAGCVIAPGATEVTFVAWGATGDETVTFVVGEENLITAGRDCDGFSLEQEVELTSSPTRYTLSFAEGTYDGLTSYADVTVGFGFLVEDLGAGPVSFFVDDIRWQ